MTSLSNKHHNQHSISIIPGSLKDPGEQPVCCNTTNQQQQQNSQKKEDAQISLLPTSKKGTSLASVTQISKLLDDYGQYLTHQSNQLKMIPLSPKNPSPYQPIQKVFENMINTNLPNLPQQSPLIKTNQNPKTKFRSQSNHQSSTSSFLKPNIQVQHTPNNRDNKNMIKRLNASKIFSSNANQETSETNNSISNFGEIISPHKQDMINRDKQNKCNSQNKQKTILTPNKIFHHPQQLNPVQNYQVLQNKQNQEGHDNGSILIDEEGKLESSNNEYLVKQRNHKAKRYPKQMLPAYTNPNQRHIDLYSDSFILQEERQNNQSPDSYSVNIAENRLQQTSQSNPCQQNKYSNLLKQNTTTSKQYVIPKIKYQIKTQNKETQKGDEDGQENGYISAFQKSLINQQHDPCNFNFIDLADKQGFNSSQVIISPRQGQDDEKVDNSSYIPKTSRERIHRRSINENRLGLNQGTKFLPLIISPQNKQSQFQQESYNGDQSITGYGNDPSALAQESVKYSNQTYGKKYFRNLKIENLIKEYEKRSIKNIFDTQIFLSQKKKEIEITSALEEKKQKEYKSVPLSNQQRINEKKNINDNNTVVYKENDAKIIDNLQVSLTKSAMTNKLEKDLKNFRERTKSSLIRGIKEIQTNEQRNDFSSAIYGYPIQNQTNLNNSSNKINQQSINGQSKKQINLNTDMGNQRGNSNVQNQNQQKEKVKRNLRRCNNSIDITNHTPEQQNSFLLQEIQQTMPLTQRNQCQPKSFNQPPDQFNSNFTTEKDILDNFLKNINLKKKYQKLQDLYPQNSLNSSPTPVNNYNNKDEHKQCLIVKPYQIFEATQNLSSNQYDNRSPINLPENDALDKYKVFIFNEQFSTDSTSQKCNNISNSTKRNSPKKRISNNNPKNCGDYTNDLNQQYIDDRGWETKTASNFDHLYGLFL